MSKIPEMFDDDLPEGFTEGAEELPEADEPRPGFRIKPVHLLAIAGVCIFLLAAGGALIAVSFADQVNSQIKQADANSFIRSEAIVNQTNANFAKVDKALNNINDALNALSAKTYQLDLSSRQVAYQNETAQIKADVQTLTATIEDLRREMRGLNLTLSQRNTTNLSAAPDPVPPRLRHYESLTCYWNLRQYFGPYLDPEEVCNKARAGIDYSGWDTQACPCAREGGINV